MKLTVVYATLGRRDIVSGALQFLAEQTRLPDRTIISATGEADVPLHFPQELAVEVVLGPKGLPAQRNTALRMISKDQDIIVFFDDDFAPASGYLEQMERLFEGDPAMAGATGRVVADGIGGPGYTFEQAREFLSQPPLAPARRRTVQSLYGCNMALRTSLAEGLSFDESLPLYAWQEDVDYTMQLGRRGRLIQSDALAGVHLGVKRSRTPGVPMGYAQVANPIYLRRKRTIAISHAYTLMAKNFAANLVKSMRPEPWCDRRGRLSGNLQAIGDFIAGRLHPRNILDMK